MVSRIIDRSSVTFLRCITAGMFTAALLLPCEAYAVSERGQDVPLYYDVRTGNVTIDTTNVEAFGGYGFEIPFDGYVVQNYTPFTGSLIVTAKSDNLGETNLGGVSPGVYSLGNVLPASLTPDELAAYFGPHENWPFRNTPYSYYAIGISTNLYHVFEPFYSPSPFLPLNDPTVGPPLIDNWAEAARLTYSAATGELTLDSTGERGGTLWSYSLYFNDDMVDVGSFAAVTVDPGRVVETRAIVEVGFTGIPEGIYSLGPILPQGLSEGQFFESVRKARFIGEVGHGAGALDLDVSGIEMSLAYIVPEPSGALLGLLAASLLLLCTRRASS